jgi:prevent-host-death family protein
MAETKSVPVTIPATQAHRRFGDLLRRVFAGKEHFIIEKDGLPVVVMLSMAEYQEVMKAREQQSKDRESRMRKFREAARAIGEEAQQMGLTEEELMGLLEEERQRLHEEGYGGKP